MSTAARQAGFMVTVQANSGAPHVAEFMADWADPVLHSMTRSTQRITCSGIIWRSGCAQRAPPT